MSKRYAKRLHALEKQYSPQRENLLLVSKDESETVQEAFDRSGKLGRREDYKILFVVGVSVKGQEEARQT
jgi:hypothetical protein